MESEVSAFGGGAVPVFMAAGLFPRQELIPLKGCFFFLALTKILRGRRSFESKERRVSVFVTLQPKNIQRS